MTVKQLSVQELKQRLGDSKPPFLLDVREEGEYQYANIDGSVLIPLNQVPARLADLDPAREIVVICHHGMRSQIAAQFLVQSGFCHIANLAGGIDAWSCQCDSSVPRY